MSAALVIARSEWRRVFLSPLVWIVLALVQVALGLVFASVLYTFSQAQLSGDETLGVTDFIGSGLYFWAVFVALFVMPLITMWTFAEERKTGSLTLLTGAPVPLAGVVVGKFLGLLGFVLAVVVLAAIMPLALTPAFGAGQHLDFGRLAAASLGLFLTLAAYAASGLFVSSLTREPVLAALGGFTLLLLFWLVEIAGQSLAGQGREWLVPLSLLGHYQAFQSGLFSTVDIAYFVLFVALFLGLTVAKLDLERQ